LLIDLDLTSRIVERIEALPVVFIDVAFHVTGDTFSPGKAEKATGLTFAKKNEVGDIGTIGRNKGKPAPYGSGELRAPFEHVYSDHEHTQHCDFGLHWLADILERHVATFIACGGDEVYVSLGVFYQDQCNMSISSEAMRKIGSCGIPLHISCYEDDDLVQSIVKWKKADELRSNVSGGAGN
jgi:hypothetical protein